MVVIQIGISSVIKLCSPLYSIVSLEISTNDENYNMATLYI